MDVEYEGSAHRIRKCALELLEIGDYLSDDDDSWDIMERDLRLKSIFMYCDFSKMISRAPKDRKKPLTGLANELLCSIEELTDAVKSRKISESYERYNDVAEVLQEVVSLVTALTPSNTNF